MSADNHKLTRGRLLASSFVVVVFSCGPTTTTSNTSDSGLTGTGDTGEPDAPDWAFGWWYDDTGNTTETNGLVLPKFEIRADGSFIQEVNYCKTPDWRHETRWELAENGALRVYPPPGDDTFPFLDYTNVSTYVELQRGPACTLLVYVGASNPTPVEFVRGQRCMQGSCSPDDIDCTCNSVPCGEGTPTCDE